VALHRNISAPVQVTDLVEASKNVASLLVCTRNRVGTLSGVFLPGKCLCQEMPDFNNTL